MTSKNISIRKGSVLNIDFENWTNFCISFENTVESYGSAGRHGNGFFSCREESYSRYLWKSLISEVRAVHLCHECFSLQSLHDFNATHLCIAASRLYFISIAFLWRRTAGSLKSEGTLGSHLIQNLLPTGSHVSSHWVSHTFRCLVLVFFLQWFTGCENRRRIKLLWVERVQGEQDCTWSAAVLVHGAQPSLASMLNCHFVLHFHDFIRLI